MTLTLDIPPKLIEEVKRFTFAKTDQEAVIIALEEFAERHDQRKLIPLLGTFSDFEFAPEEDHNQDLR